MPTPLPGFGEKEPNWSKPPEFDADSMTEVGEEAPQRQRKERSDKGVPRGPRVEGAPRRRRGGSLKEGIGGMLTMINLPVQMFAPVDALDMAELEALAMALDEQCRISPTFRKYVERMLGVASGGQLIAVAGMIGTRRLARHGLLGAAGEQVDMTLGSNLQAMTNQPANTPQYPKRELEQPEQAIMQPTGESNNGESAIGGIPAVGADTWTPPIG